MADSTNHHMVAIPYPGRGHINPMINLCKLIALRRPSDFLITVVLTDKWLGLIGSEPKPHNILFASIPNVIPLEANRANDIPGFMDATQTKMEDPVEQLLRGMEVPVGLLIYDMLLPWVVNTGDRMNIPVATLCTFSATLFSMVYHYNLLVEHRHVGDNFPENSEEIVDYLPGVPPIRVADLPIDFNKRGKEARVKSVVLKAVSMSTKAQFLVLATVYELEARVIDAFRSDLSIPVYTIGPAIPYFNLNNMQNDQNTPEYVKWLDRQPEGSLLYISQGSFLSVSNAQLDEIIAGVHDSGVLYMWIARGEASRFKNDEKGLVIPWCDQLRVLCHPSIGGFWSHCGWNSTKECAFSGKPMIAFPILGDQVPNSKMIVEDWKTGMRVRFDEGVLVPRENISELVRCLMDPESEKGREMRTRAKEVQQICGRAIVEEGSALIDIDFFIRDVSNSIKSRVV